MYGQKYTNCLDSVHHLPHVFHGILQHPILDAFILENKAQIHICLKLCQRHKMQLDICKKFPTNLQMHVVCSGLLPWQEEKENEDICERTYAQASGNKQFLRI